MSDSAFEEAAREVEDLLAQMHELQVEIDGDRLAMLEEHIDDRATDHTAAYGELADRARSGELGPEWRKLQGRIDLNETSLDKVFGGDDTSREAEFVRSVVDEKATQLLDLQQKPEDEDDYEMNFSTFAAVREEQAEIMKMLEELRDLPLPPMD